MKQEDKQLVLKDLCARIPYGVKVIFPKIRQDIATLVGINDSCYIVTYEHNIIYCSFKFEIKPHLRPMSSMTEEEEFILDETRCWTQLTLESYDWLLAHHFDFRGLIEKGLALEALEGMYETK